MLFSPKTKGFYVEQNHDAFLLARTGTSHDGLVLEAVAEAPAGDSAALAGAIREIQPKKAQSGYLNASCGIYPTRRLLRRATLELKRVKEAGYFAELLSTQFRVEPEKYTVHVLNANDGTDYDTTKATQKEVIFCGVMGDDVITAQDDLLASGIYPDRLELGSIALLGGLVDYLAFKKSKTPTLVLELGAEVTHSFIVSGVGVEASRPIPQGLESMVPIVQKELNLKDAESARKLFFSNTFDFAGMGPLLVKKLLKELQSSIGFYEVQTGQSVGQVVCTGIPAKLAWLASAISTALGVPNLDLELVPWLSARRVAVPDAVAPKLDARWFGLLSLMTAPHAPTPPPASPDAVPAEKKA